MPIKSYPIRLKAISTFIEQLSKAEAEIACVFDKEYTDEEWHAYGEAEQDEILDTLLSFQGMIVRTVIYELNALVEYELRWKAKVIRRKNIGLSLSREKEITRQEAVSMVEQEYNVELKILPSFDIIEDIRKIANAYKHDDGFSNSFQGFFNMRIEKRYKLDIEKVEAYLSAVKEFLRALPGDNLNLGQDVRIKQSHLNNRTP